MIVGNIYSYTFSASIQNTCSTDILRMDDSYQTTGVFVGMTHETNYCIFVNKFAVGYRLHYVVMEQVNAITHSAKNVNCMDLMRLVSNVAAFMHSDTYSEPLSHGYTPVLFVRDFKIGSVKKTRELKYDLETTYNYCDMV